MFLNFVIFLAIILCTSFFVLAEAALIISKAPRLEKMKRDGSRGAEKALVLSHEPEKYLSTVQIGITLMSVLLGLYGGHNISKFVSEYVMFIPYISQYSAEISDIIALLMITYCTVLGEIIPKRIAMLHPERTASIISHIMIIAIKIAYPLVWILSISARFVMRLIRVQHPNSDVTIEELKIVINNAESTGAVKKTERDMMRRLLHLDDMVVGAVMTPRSKMVSIDINDSQDELIKKIKKYKFSAFPVIDSSIDNVLGIIHVKDLIYPSANIDQMNINANIKPVFYVPEVARFTQLIEQLKIHSSKIAIVVDEYGDVEGIVTLNDIIKTFAGDMVAMIDGAKPTVIQNKDEFIMPGNVLIEEVKDLLCISELPGETSGNYRTIASFIIEQLNNVPKAGDEFISIGWKFKVIRMDNFRIDKVSITRHFADEFSMPHTTTPKPKL